MTAKHLTPENSYDSFIADVRLNLGNEAKTQQGGTGAGIYYLQSIDNDEIGAGAYGYTNKFRGLGVFINTMLYHTEPNGDVLNYVQVVYSDGDRPVNLMKIHSERSCKRPIRNLANDQDFFVRIEYQAKQITVSTWDHDNKQLEHCATIDQEMNF